MIFLLHFLLFCINVFGSQAEWSSGEKKRLLSYNSYLKEHINAICLRNINLNEARLLQRREERGDLHSSFLSNIKRRINDLYYNKENFSQLILDNYFDEEVAFIVQKLICPMYCSLLKESEKGSLRRELLLDQAQTITEKESLKCGMILSSLSSLGVKKKLPEIIENNFYILSNKIQSAIIENNFYILSNKIQSALPLASEVKYIAPNRPECSSLEEEMLNDLAIQSTKEEEMLNDLAIQSTKNANSWVIIFHPELPFYEREICIKASEKWKGNNYRKIYENRFKKISAFEEQCEKDSIPKTVTLGQTTYYASNSQEQKASALLELSSNIKKMILEYQRLDDSLKNLSIKNKGNIFRSIYKKKGEYKKDFCHFQQKSQEIEVGSINISNSTYTDNLDKLEAILKHIKAIDNQHYKIESEEIEKIANAVASSKGVIMDDDEDDFINESGIMDGEKSFLIKDLIKTVMASFLEMMSIYGEKGEQLLVEDRMEEDVRYCTRVTSDRFEELVEREVNSNLSINDSALSKTTMVSGWDNEREYNDFINILKGFSDEKKRIESANDDEIRVMSSQFYFYVGSAEEQRRKLLENINKKIEDYCLTKSSHERFKETVKNNESYVECIFKSELLKQNFFQKSPLDIYLKNKGFLFLVSFVINIIENEINKNEEIENEINKNEELEALIEIFKKIEIILFRLFFLHQGLSSYLSNWEKIFFNFYQKGSFREITEEQFNNAIEEAIILRKNLRVLDKKKELQWISWNDVVEENARELKVFEAEEKGGYQINQFLMALPEIEGHSGSIDLRQEEINRKINLFSMIDNEELTNFTSFNNSYNRRLREIFLSLENDKLANRKYKCIKAWNEYSEIDSAEKRSAKVLLHDQAANHMYLLQNRQAKLESIKDRSDSQIISNTYFWCNIIDKFEEVLKYFYTFNDVRLKYFIFKELAEIFDELKEGNNILNYNLGYFYIESLNKLINLLKITRNCLNDRGDFCLQKKKKLILRAKELLKEKKSSFYCQHTKCFDCEFSKLCNDAEKRLRREVGRILTEEFGYFSLYFSNDFFIFDEKNDCKINDFLVSLNRLNEEEKTVLKIVFSSELFRDFYFLKENQILVEKEIKTELQALQNKINSLNNKIKNYQNSILLFKEKELSLKEALLAKFNNYFNIFNHIEDASKKIIDGLLLKFFEKNYFISSASRLPYYKYIEEIKRLEKTQEKVNYWKNMALINRNNFYDENDHQLCLLFHIVKSLFLLIKYTEGDTSLIEYHYNIIASVVNFKNDFLKLLNKKKNNKKVYEKIEKKYEEIKYDIESVNIFDKKIDDDFKKINKENQENDAIEIADDFVQSILNAQKEGGISTVRHPVAQNLEYLSVKKPKSYSIMTVSTDAESDDEESDDEGANRANCLSESKLEIHIDYEEIVNKIIKVAKEKEILSEKKCEELKPNVIRVHLMQLIKNQFSDDECLNFQKEDYFEENSKIISSEDEISAQKCLFQKVIEEIKKIFFITNEENSKIISLESESSQIDSEQEISESLESAASQIKSEQEISESLESAAREIEREKSSDQKLIVPAKKSNKMIEFIANNYKKLLAIIALLSMGGLFVLSYLKQILAEGKTEYMIKRIKLDNLI